jgi:hypothetical protein
MLEVELPRDIAYMVRNRLLFRKIPYEEVSVDKIALDPVYADVVKEIIAEVKKLKNGSKN